MANKIKNLTYKQSEKCLVQKFQVAKYMNLQLQLQNLM
jgi:hypothetical protein